jgi:hypothetical protein
MLAGGQREPNADSSRTPRPYRDLVMACPLTENACFLPDRDSKTPLFYGIRIHRNRKKPAPAKPRLYIHNNYSRRSLMTDHIFRCLHPLSLACSALLGEHGPKVSGSVQGGNFGRYS